ncbi:MULTISPECIES: TetR family transcriptional regulator [Burkholderia cepacia complex]|uniref:TetR family transcriptional regulator n=1 Tax=Burkholderia cepacia complex TaxID=87882 RepID=UPI00158AC6C0|nr:MULTISPECIES: TetR family transcriptional regulator [Burkholderia cepacia complex]MBR8374115.1 TetR family transcriptional regulator [Burkholderia cenocepacia]MBR8443040.1 TetR family transcriptional regulator [Burkholderia cenocepacia]MDN7850932.1 TetR family transcriptional regulator [Burkholderia seminalis]UVE67736.1 TetR family transcriptional regulator [Burkholderia pyrrocinia]
MAETRKSGEAREKELRLAIHRIQRGRAHTKVTKLSIAAVAREAGVSPALIHNHYPGIAETIRNAQGRDSRAQRDQKHQELIDERNNLAMLRKEIAALRFDIARLSSINEVLTFENAILKSKLDNSKVIELPRTPTDRKRNDA